MKTLYINSKKFDYGQDLMFAGLATILGKDSIRDYPRNFSYHFNFKTYPKNLGRVGGGVSTFLASQAITAENCDVAILGCAKPDALEAYLDVLKTLPASTPTVVIEGGDPEAIGGEAKRLGCEDLWNEIQKKRPFDFIFKREFMKNREYAANVFPLPFSINLGALAVGPADHFDKDVSFWAVESHPIRTQALELLKGKFDCDRNGTAKNQVFKHYKYKGRRYHEELAKCRIVLSFRGGGWDTLRYWEVPALGPLLISQKLDIVIPHDYEDKKHIVHCRDDLSDLIELCEYYLTHEDERQKIAAAAYAHTKQFHTHTARAQYVLDTLKSRASLS